MSADAVIELSPLVHVVGVSHRGLESAEVVRRLISDEQPDVIAVELDDPRLRWIKDTHPQLRDTHLRILRPLAGRSDAADVETSSPDGGSSSPASPFLGLKGRVYERITRSDDDFQHMQLAHGHTDEATYAEEMVAAIQGARGREVALIDRDYRVDVSRVSHTIPWRALLGCMAFLGDRVHFPGSYKPHWYDMVEFMGWTMLRQHARCADVLDRQLDEIEARYPRLCASEEGRKFQHINRTYVLALRHGRLTDDQLEQHGREMASMYKTTTTTTEKGGAPAHAAAAAVAGSATAAAASAAAAAASAAPSGGLLATVAAAKADMDASTASVHIDERDRIMCEALRRVSKGGRKVLAVVGAAHCAGIEKAWHNPVQEDDWRRLLHVPWSYALDDAYAPVAALAASGWVLTRMPRRARIVALGVGVVGLGAAALLFTGASAQFERTCGAWAHHHAQPQAHPADARLLASS